MATIAERDDSLVLQGDRNLASGFIEFAKTGESEWDYGRIAEFLRGGGDGDGMTAVAWVLSHGGWNDARVISVMRDAGWQEPTVATALRNLAYGDPEWTDARAVQGLIVASGEDGDGYVMGVIAYLGWWPARVLAALKTIGWDAGRMKSAMHAAHWSDLEIAAVFA